ncbi:MAG: VOC family protein [Caldilineaceae bacterium]|nr:VOC family protein [Caldilineaceae bacterium]
MSESLDSTTNTSTNTSTNTTENSTADTRIDLGPMVQVGIIVHDAEAAVAAWTSRFKLAPAHFVDWPIPGKNLEETATYHGRRGNFRMRLAFLQAGPMQIEFIQPLEGDNIYSDFLNEHGEGLHHLLFEVEDPAAVAAGLGATVLQSGGSSLRPGAIWSYLDTQEMLGAMIELRTKI